MMNAAFAELGLDWRYLRLPVPPELFAATVAALPGSGYRGANVTIPHKLAAHALADELSAGGRGDRRGEHALLRGGGRIRGDNTDAGGLLDALGEPAPATRAGARRRRRGPRGGLGAPRGGRRGDGLEPDAERGAALADEFGVRHATARAPPTCS